MSQRKKKEEDKPSDGSLGTALAAGAAVVGATALAYGVWKLYDLLSSSSSAEVPLPAEKPAKKVCDSSDEERDDMPSHARRRTNHLEETFSTNASSSHHTVNRETTLSSQLLDYYHRYVEVQPVEMRETTKLVKNMKIQLLCQLQRNEKLRALNFFALEETGSSTNGMLVVVPENFDVVVHFQMNPDECGLSQQSTESEYYSVEMKQCDDQWSAVCDDQKHLLQEKLIGILSGALDDAVSACKSQVFKKVCDSSVGERDAVRKASIAIEGYCHLRKFTINITPAVNIGERRFVAEVPSDSDTVGKFCWRESYALEEERILNRFGPGISGHKVILKIFKAIRLNFPLQFGLLTTYHYKTVLFRIMDYLTEETDWDTSAISERFIDFLIELGNCLKEGNIPHYFRPSCNLLDQVPVEMLQSLAQFINKIVGQHDIASLLKYDYPQQ